jgi:hypothetical protein
MPRDPLKVYRDDRRREAVWEALDAPPVGVEFTLRQLWRGDVGGRQFPASYSMTRTVLRDAVAAGFVEKTGRLAVHGAPNVYRRVR